MNSKKIKLGKLSVKSFQTSVTPLNAETVKGGRFHQKPDTVQAECGSHSCPSGGGVLCTVFC